ncbi:MAG: hypothetical protein HY428_00130 [Candidatus Levybacteria bacterium]|nr:hypothetical protein [Candidatus Levybacteria bacterium]
MIKEVKTWRVVNRKERSEKIIEPGSRIVLSMARRFPDSDPVPTREIVVLSPTDIAYVTREIDEEQKIVELHGEEINHHYDDFITVNSAGETVYRMFVPDPPQE